MAAHTNTCMTPIRVNGQPSVHGHRGSRGTLPENTIESFEEAFKCGAHFFELDVQFSQDEVPIVFHDTKITSRLCTYEDGRPIKDPIAIKEIKAEDLLQFDCGNTLQADFPDQQKIGKRKIATLEEVFLWMKNNKVSIRANIEIKIEREEKTLTPDCEKMAFKVVQLLRKYDLLHRSLVQSFDFEPLKVVRRLEPRLAMSVLFDEEEDFVKHAAELQTNAIGPNFRFVTEQLVKDAKKQKLDVLPWTVNDPADWKTQLNWDVAGIITDYPRKLIEWLKSRKGH